jgi:hypothetical protein
MGSPLFGLNPTETLATRLISSDLGKSDGRWFGRRWVCDSELIELAKALGKPLVELFPARVQAVVKGKR